MTKRMKILGLALLTLAPRTEAAFSPEKMDLVDRPFQAEFAALSPDGKYLAYTDYQDGRLRLNVNDLDRKTRKAIPLDRIKEKSATFPRLRELRWVSADRIVVVSSDLEIVSIGADGSNPAWLWDRNDNGLVQEMYLVREPYFIQAAPPRIHPPLADDPGHLLIEGVATIGTEMLVNAYKIDVRTGERTLARKEDYLGYQVALYGPGDMILWPPQQDPLRWSLYIARLMEPPPWTIMDAMRDRPFATRLRMEAGLDTIPTPEQGGAVIGESSSGGRMIYDRQGNPRILFAEPTSGQPRQFLYFKPGEHVFQPNVRQPPIEKALGEPRPRDFVLSAENYFGERSYPIGFDFDPDILYFASNVGRDTFGIYSLNLRTRDRVEIAPGIKGVDLASGDPAETGGILVFDEKEKKLVGVRYATVRPRTLWLDAGLAELQARFEREFPRYAVEILSWDEARRRFLLRVASEDDPGALFVFHRAEDRMELIVGSAPWLAGTELNPSTGFAFETPAGVTLSGYLTLPNSPKVGPPPLLVYLQGGLWDRAEPGFSREAELLAEMGVAVMRLNYRGSVGFGRSHFAAIQEGIDTVPSEDILAAVEWLNSRWKLDLKRVIVMGEGLGGYIALRALQLHPDRFRAGISLNAPTSLAAWGTSRPLRPKYPMYKDGSFEAPPPFDFMAEVRGAFIRGIRRDGTPAAPAAAGADRAVLVVESAYSTETTPFSSFLAGIGIGARGVSVEHVYIGGDFKGGTRDTRLKVFQRIEEFLNLNLYEFGTGFGEVREVKAAPAKK